MIIRSILFLIFSIFLSGVQSHYKCGHDHINTEIEFHDAYQGENSVNGKQRILATAKQAIRITEDISRLSTLPTDMQNHIKDQFQVAKLFFSKILKVIPISGNLQFSSQINTCGSEITVNSSDQTTGIANSDMHFYIGWVNDPSSSFVAYAGACILEANTLRPLFARVIYNTNYFQYTVGNHYQFEKNLETTIHEMTHAFGFSGSLYKYYYDSNSGIRYDSSLYTNSYTISSLPTTLLKTPNVVQAARTYFGCSTLDGMPLENQGSSGSLGSHWERTAIYNDMMTASVTTGRAYFTVFDFALLKDTGWYDVDESLVENSVQWGKNKGCNFVMQACSNNDSEFCYTSGNTACDVLATSSGKCGADQFSSLCMVQIPYSNYICQDQTQVGSPLLNYYFNWDSRCFQSSLYQHPTSTISAVNGCYQSHCTDNGTKITINIGTDTIVCDTPNDVKTLTGYTGTFTCPSDIPKFCGIEYSCPLFCSGKGFCNNNKCYCLPNYYGPGCQCYQQYYKDGVCMSSCPSGYYSYGNRICLQQQCVINDTVYNCLACSGDNCTNCATTYYLNAGKCYKCGNNCNTCTNSATCTACQAGFLLQGLICQASCDIGYYADSNSICQPCIQYCKICSNSTTCTECFSVYYLHNSNTQCLSICPVNYYINTNQCSPCHANCNGCTGPNNTNCTQCKSNKFLKSGACVDACDSNQYISTNSNGSQCLNCPNGCDACSNGSNCTTCATGQFNQGGICKASCDLGYYSDSSKVCQHCLSNCQQCSNSSLCSSCVALFYLYSSSNNSNYNQCLQNCPSNYYIYNQTTCKACDSSCDGCNGSLNTNCLKCKSGYYLNSGACVNACNSNQFISGNQCINCQIGCDQCTSSINCTSCQSPYFNQGGICQTLCNSSYYFDSNRVCQPCLANCQACTDSSTCTQCLPSYYLQNGNTQCKTSCSLGYYSDTTKVCQPCLANCQTCTNSTTCTTCYQSYNLVNMNTQCISQCGANQYLNGSSCSPCHSNCDGCTGGLKTNCINCAAGKVLKQGACENSCDSNQFQSPISSGFECLFCQTSCLSCTNSLNCTNCGTLMNQSGICKSACDIGYYGDSNKICKNCMVNCQVCTNSSTCTQCNNGYYLYNNTCVSNCPVNFYISQLSCLACHPNCDGCQGGGANTNCIKCKTGKFLNLGACIDSCNSNQYAVPISSGQQCQDCQTGCLQCLNASNCTNCGTLINQGGVCKTGCDPGYYLNSSNICVVCYPNCKLCSSATICTQCLSNYYLHNNGQQCVSSCPTGFYLNGQQCLICHPNCDGCTGGANTDCIKCKTGKFLKSRTCVDSCDSNQYINTISSGEFQCLDCGIGCATCTSSNQCITCAIGFVNQLGNCQTTCADSYFNNGGTCKPCASTCKNCTGLQQNQCTECLSPQKLYKNTCISSCSGNMYLSTDSKECLDCDIACNGCTGPTASNCTACAAQFQLQSGVCIQICLQGQYSSGGSCLPCSQNCNICQSSSNCTQCKTGFKNQQGICLTQCNSGYYTDSLNNCQQCDTSCLTCSGPNSNQCTSCLSGLKFYQNECLTSCPVNTFVQNNACYLCDVSCNGCNSIGNNNCIQCGLSYYKNGNSCVTSCNSNQYYDSNKICYNCSANCATCTNGSSCQICQQGYVNQNGVCQIQCNQNYYKSSNGTCQLCATNCTSCNSPSTQDCLSCSLGYYLYNKSCITSCPINTFQLGFTCQICDNSCSTCQTSSTNCLICNPNYYRNNNNCVLNCNTNQYKSENPKTCLNCQTGCLSCLNDTTCLVCDSSTVNMNGVCKSQCDINYFVQQNGQNICKKCPNNCKTCNSQNSNDCISCYNQTNFYQGQCVQICPNGYYAINNVCQQCDISCSTCLAAGNIGCIQCRQGYQKDSTNACISQCSSGNYYNVSYQRCELCVSNCSICLDSTSCQVCAVGFKKQGNNCQAQCNMGFYPDYFGVCQICSSNCLTCDDSTNNSCLSCRSPLTLYSKSCLSQCPLGTIQSIDKNGLFSCITCDVSCNQCTGEGNDKCIACAAGYKLINSKCISINDIPASCLKGQYYDQSIQGCVKCPSNCPYCTSLSDCSKIGYKCHFSCNQCLGASFNQCISCVENRVLIGYQRNQIVGECTCPSDTTDNFEAACSKSKSAEVQKQLQVSTTVVASSTTLITGTLAMKSPFFLQMADFSQTIGALSYVNRKNANQFDQNSEALRKVNINYLIKSPFSEKNSKSRILQQSIDLVSQNKIEQIHGSSSFLVNCFIIFMVNSFIILFMIIMRLIPFKKEIEQKQYLIKILRVIQTYSQLMLPVVCFMFTISEMSLCMFLQFYLHSDSISEYKDSGLALAIVSLLYIFGMLSYLFYLAAAKTNQQIEEDRSLIYYFSLLKTSSFLTKAQYPLISIKKMLYSLMLVVLYEYPELTVIFILLIEIVYLIYLIITKPFKELWINLVSILSSIGLAIINTIFLIMTFVDSEQSSTQTDCILAIVIITNILLVLYSIFTIISGIKALRNIFFGTKTVQTEKSLNIKQIAAPCNNTSFQDAIINNQSAYIDEKQIMFTQQTKRNDLVPQQIDYQSNLNQQQKNININSYLRTQNNNNITIEKSQYTENINVQTQLNSQQDYQRKKLAFQQRKKQNKLNIQQQNNPQQQQLDQINEKMVNKYIKQRGDSHDYANILNNSQSYELPNRF